MSRYAFGASAPRIAAVVATLAIAAIGSAQRATGFGGTAGEATFADNPRISMISTGWRHTLIVNNNGLFQQYGTAGASAPGGIINPIDIAAGYRYSLAINSTGSILVWGNAANIPAGTPSGSNWKQVAAGYVNGGAVRNDGTYQIWGDNSFGQVSNAPAVAMKDVKVGYQFVVGLTEAGSLRAWGLGDAFNNFITSNANIPAGTDFVDISVSTYGDHALALRSNGTVAAWGRNSAGQCTVPAIVGNTATAGFVPVVAIAAGDEHSVALLSNGNVVAWGSNSAGQRNINGQTNTELISAGSTASVKVTPKPVGTIAFNKSTVVGNSATTMTGTITLTQPDPTGDVLVALTSSDTTSAPLPVSTVTIPAGQTTGTFTVNHKEVATNTNFTVTGRRDIKTATVNGTLTPFNYSLSSAQSTVLKGTSATVTVTFDDPMKTSTTANVTAAYGLVVPPTVTIPANTSSVSFNVDVLPLATTGTLAVNVSARGVDKSISFTTQHNPAMLVGKITITKTVYGLGWYVGTITMNNQRSTSHTVSLTSSNSNLEVPATVTIPAQVKTATFIAKVKDFSGAFQSADITASNPQNSVSTTLTLRPNTLANPTPQDTTVTVGGAPVTVTFNLLAPVGEDLVLPVTSNFAGVAPATLTIPAGQNSASLQVTYGEAHRGRIIRVQIDRKSVV